mgnify:CR=1 FL=1
MFKINANPTFEATLTIVGQGREQKLNLSLRHKTKSQYAELFKGLQEGNSTPVDVILELVEKWDADTEFSRTSLEQLQEQQPGADWAIITGYGEALVVARKGN